MKRNSSRRRNTSQASSIPALEQRTLLSVSSMMPDILDLNLQDANSIADAGGVFTGTETHVTGLVGQGVSIDSGNKLEFDSLDRIDPVKGTVSFWIKPTWNGNDDTWSGSRILFQAGNIRIGVYNSSTTTVGGYLFLRYDDATGAQREVAFQGINNSANSQTFWSANTWHHVEASWDLSNLSASKLILISDNNPASVVSSYVYNGIAPMAAKFTIGTDSTGNAAALAAFDEFTISSEPRFLAALNDASGAANSGTSTATFSAGLLGNAALFDSTTDFLEYDTLDRIDGVKGTLSMWVKPMWNGSDSWSGWRRFFSAGNLSLGAYADGTANTGRIVFRYDDATGTQREISYTGIRTQWLANTWHRVEVSWDLTNTASGQLTLVVDNNPAVTNSLAYNGIAAMANKFQVGAVAGGSGFALASIDEVRISREQRKVFGLQSSAIVAAQGGAATGTVTYGAGQYGNGISTGAGTNYVSFANDNAVSSLTGHVSFWVKPNWAGNSAWTGSRLFFQAGEIKVGAYNPGSANGGYLYLRYDDKASPTGSQQREVSTSGIEDQGGGVRSWAAGSLHLVEIFWDLTNLADAKLAIVVDSGSETQMAKGLNYVAAPTSAPSIQIGNNVDGVVDQVTIFDKSTWNFDNPIASYQAMTAGNGIWENHETIYNSPNDAPVLSSTISPGVNYLFYSKPPFEKIYDGTAPLAGDITSAYATTAARNEFNTTFLNLYSRQNQNGATLSFGTFTQNGVATSGITAEMRIVENWWQAGTGPTKNLLPNYTPELLISDETAGDFAALTTGTWSYTTLPSLPNFSDGHVKMNLKASTSKQIAFRIKSSATTPPGVYTTTVTLKDAAGVTLQTATLTFEVLPFELQESGKDFTTYFQARTDLTSSQDYVPVAEYVRQIDDLVNHGFNTLIVYDPTVGTTLVPSTSTTLLQYMKNKGIKKVIMLATPTATLVSQMTAVGFTPFFYGIDEPNDTTRIVQQINLSKTIHDLGGQVFTAITKTWAERLAVDATPGVSQNITGSSWASGQVTITTAAAHGLTVGSTVYITGTTPTTYNGVFTVTAVSGNNFSFAMATNPGVITTFGKSANSVYALPGVTTPTQRQTLNYANLSVYSGGQSQYIYDLASGVGSQTPGRTEGYYWQIMQENPVIDRSMTGFFLYDTGLNGVAPYVYQAVRNNPYDDFDIWSNNYRDHLATYPSQQGPVSTIQWEAAREGIDDIRFLKTWEFYKTQVSASDPDRIASEAAINAVKSHYNTYSTVFSVSMATFAADRAAIIAQIKLMRSKLPFQETAGLISIDAENFHSKTTVAGGSWSVETQSTAAQGKSIVAPSSPAIYSGLTGPHADYKVTFATTGNYYLWLRAFGVNTSSDSVHVDVLNAAGTTVRTYSPSLSNTGVFAWTNASTSLTVPVAAAGTYTIRVWMREANAHVDKLVLTTGSSYNPAAVNSGYGPMESGRSPGNTLTASGNVQALPGTSPFLTQSQLNSVINEAKRRWQLTGVSATRFNGVEFQISELSNASLGSTNGKTITIDRDAAGLGWFIDSTPLSDSEFLQPGDQGEQGHYDLLTAVMHELGHTLGLGHSENAGSVMNDTLAQGVRHSPNGFDLISSNDNAAVSFWRNWLSQQPAGVNWINFVPVRFRRWVEMNPTEGEGI